MLIKDLSWQKPQVLFVHDKEGEGYFEQIILSKVNCSREPWFREIYKA